MKEVVEGFKVWFKVACYVAFVWWLLDFLPLLPEPIANRIIESALSKLP